MFIKKQLKFNIEAKFTQNKINNQSSTFKNDRLNCKKNKNIFDRVILLLLKSQIILFSYLL